MDMQKIADLVLRAAQADRDEEVRDGEQLVLLELVHALRGVKDPSLPVEFDDTSFFPSGLDSWRGIYRELAFTYGQTADASPGPDAGTVLAWLEAADGEEFYGYKGGTFRMGKTTPVWVANHGETAAWDSETKAVVGIEEVEDRVIIRTAYLEV